MNTGDTVIYQGKEAQILQIGKAADKANPDQKILIMVDGESVPKIVNSCELVATKKML